MNNTLRTFARPPRTNRTPRCEPLSWFMGATPTKAAIAPLEVPPSSGKLESRVADTTGPTPGTLCSKLSKALSSGLERTNSSIWAFMSSTWDSKNSITACKLARALSSRALPNRLRSMVSISRIWVRRVTIASRVRRASGAGVMISGRIRDANSASITASIASVLACFPIAVLDKAARLEQNGVLAKTAPSGPRRTYRACSPIGPVRREKSRTCLGLTTASGNWASLHPSSKACSRPPVLSHTSNVGLAFLANFTKAWIPADVLSNSSTSPVARLNTSSRGLARVYADEHLGTHKNLL